MAPVKPTAPMALDWNDLQALLALVRGGSLRRASLRYGSSPAPMLRRLDKLEAAVGVQLVERTSSGSQLTVAGRQVFEHAEAIERLAGEISRAREQRDADAAQGTVRINADEWVSFLLTRQAAPLRAEHPGLNVEIITTHRPYSITRGEADIVVRPLKPTGDHLVGRAVGTLGFGLYGSRTYVREHTDPIKRGMWGTLNYVGFDEGRQDFEAERWLRARTDPVVPWLRCSYALGIYDGILAGAGLGVLAQFIARDDDRLAAVQPDIAELRQRYWMTFHKTMRQSARLRVVADFIVRSFAEDA